MRRFFSVLFIVVMALSLTSVGLAQVGGFSPVSGAITQGTTIQSSVLKEKVIQPDVSLVGGPPDRFKSVSIIVTFDQGFDASTLEAATGGKIIYRYTKIFNGASLVLPGSKVADVAALPGVKNVYLDQLLKPDTEVSPGFIGAPTVWNALGGQGNAGENVTVGVLDTGIWPEHPSFSDPDPYGKVYLPPATIPGSNGFGSGGPRNTCDFGNTAYNSNDASFTCNNKLIGAYSFIDTYKAVIGLLPNEFDSARDDNGHGTHTSSTAAGNRGVAASIFGVPRGTISGIAPRAHVIMYRVCGDQGCYTSDSMRATEQAILDNVDAINFSISGGGNPYSDVVSLAFLAAYENGVFVAASAGNSGPGADTTDHREPWVTTVAASNTNRFFISTVSLHADNNDTLTLHGASVTDGIYIPTPVIFPPSGQELCLTPFAPGTFSGEIVICERGINARVEKSYNVAQGGAGGMLLYNPTLQGLATDNHFIPSVHLENDAGDDLLNFMAGHTGVTATFTQGIATTVPGDVMAAFSSRGGPNQTLGVSKPDITAPGVQILAGNTPMGATVVTGLPGELFQAIQGTSMSSPHIAGSAALLKDLHPNWTPGQIKSALMTTAYGGVVKEDGVTPATPFDDGSGRVNLNYAGDPGMTFDETGANYVALQSHLWDSNYPSLYVPTFPGSITTWRTVRSVSNSLRVWRTTVIAPSDLNVVVPRLFLLGPNGTNTFSITVDGKNVPLGAVRHAWVLFNSGGIQLRFPITVVRKQPVVSMTKTCNPAVVRPFIGYTDCAITLQNNGFDPANFAVKDTLPVNLQLMPASLVGATLTGPNSFAAADNLAPIGPPDVFVNAGISPAGYLPLSLFGGTVTLSGAGDETCTNFNVPSYPFAGKVWSTIGLVSDGYAVVGGCGGNADIQFINQVLPDPARPNNVLAPFWTDLNPGTGGAMRINVLTDGIDTWIVLDWDAVRNYSSATQVNSFEIWIGITGDTHPGEDISYAYGTVTTGEGGYLTVGAENEYGNRGQNYYVDGAGTPPSSSEDVVVTTAPSTPGEIYQILYTARGFITGDWNNCAKMVADTFPGTNIACFAGSTH